jgi:hypothetical protein
VVGWGGYRSGVVRTGNIFDYVGGGAPRARHWSTA